MDIKELSHNWIVRNLVLGAAFVLGVALVASIILAIVTQHSRRIVVPDFTNMTFQEASVEAEKVGIRVEIIDSVYVRRMKKGVVFSQNPKAGFEVKKGRKVALTTNALQAKKVSMPDLIGLSMRQAKAELASRGLFLGKLIYVEDMATNNVLSQQYRGADVSAGTMIEAGSYINLVLGLDLEESTTIVPELKGMKYQRALDIIQENSLNIGRTVFDNSVKDYSDTLNAFVFRQGPSANTPVDKGNQVTIFLSVDKSKLQ